MKRLLVVAFCCVVIHVNGQTRFDYSLSWSEGSVVLLTGDTLTCKLRYNQSFPEGVVQILDGENIKCLSVKDLKAFSYQDEKKNRLRNFCTMRMPYGEFVDKPYFCERLYHNSRFAIVRHRALGTPYEYMHYSRFFRRPVVMNHQYLLDESSGKMLPLCRQNVLQLLGEKKAEITSFIESNSIKFKTVADYVKVFDYHSSL